MFDLDPDQVDPEFGVVRTDSQEGLYTILVDSTAQAQVEEKLRLTGADTDPAVGIFANPRIETCGPPLDAIEE